MRVPEASRLGLVHPEKDAVIAIPIRRQFDELALGGVIDASAFRVARIQTVRPLDDEGRACHARGALAFEVIGDPAALLAEHQIDAGPEPSIDEFRVRGLVEPPGVGILADEEVVSRLQASPPFDSRIGSGADEAKPQGAAALAVLGMIEVQDESIGLHQQGILAEGTQVEDDPIVLEVDGSMAAHGVVERRAVHDIDVLDEAHARHIGDGGVGLEHREAEDQHEHGGGHHQGAGAAPDRTCRARAEITAREAVAQGVLELEQALAVAADLEVVPQFLAEVGVEGLLAQAQDLLAHSRLDAAVTVNGWGGFSEVHAIVLGRGKSPLTQRRSPADLTACPVFPGSDVGGNT